MRTVWTLTLIQIAQLLLFFRKTLTKKQDLFKIFQIFAPALGLLSRFSLGCFSLVGLLSFLSFVLFSETRQDFCRGAWRRPGVEHLQLENGLAQWRNGAMALKHHKHNKLGESQDLSFGVLGANSGSEIQ